MPADLQGARSEARADRRGRETGAISFAIQGTTSNPSFVPGVSGLAANAVKGAVAGNIGGEEPSNPVSAGHWRIREEKEVASDVATGESP
jgi:hypothetical protein